MAMAGFDSYDFVLRERPLAAFRVLANHRLISGEIPQLPNFRDGDRGFVPLIFAALDVHEELLAGVLRGSFNYSFWLHILLSATVARMKH